MVSAQDPARPVIANIGSLQPSVEQALSRMTDEQIIRRIREHDHTVWKQDPADIVNRLGWLTSPEKMGALRQEIANLADDLRDEGFTHALLMGMGGSSLAPEVFRFTFGVKKGYLDLAVLDSTDPRVVEALGERLDPLKTLYIVSTKSGGTVETLSFFKYFYNKTVEKMGAATAGAHFIAITDPGSRLETLGRKLDFRKIFLNDPDIGGRYSVLSCFGLVPAALVGVDLGILLDRAAAMAAPDREAGAHLGAMMGELALAGRDKLTLILSPAISHFGSWVEQLIAESTGKEGKGILPVNGEAVLAPDDYANDRFFVYLCLKGDTTHDEPVRVLKDAGHPVVEIYLNDLYDIGGEFFRWEMATAVAGYRLGINPFDQPNVESAKISARQILAAYQEAGRLPELIPTLTEDGMTVYADELTHTMGDTIATVLQHFLAPARTDENKAGLHPYVALQAYLQPSPETDEALAHLRTRIQTRLKAATTVGYGPRFLHSTGQLHKGDGGHGLFIQFTDDPSTAIDIPDTPGETGSTMTFGALMAAQALGDRQALLDAGRKVIRFHLGRDVDGGLKRLARIVTEMNY